MNEKRALKLAYDLFVDELDRVKAEDMGLGFGYDEEYYQVVKEASETIKEMIKERK